MDTRKTFQLAGKASYVNGDQKLDDFFPRARYWEPYRWSRSGMGPTRPEERDYAPAYGIAGEPIKKIAVYGITGRDRKVLPLRVGIGLKRRMLVLDRAEHNLGKVELFDPFSSRSLGRITTMSFIPIFREKTGFDAEFFNGATPNRLIKTCKNSPENFDGALIEKMILMGNYTCAQGLLVNRILFKFDKGRILHIAIASLNVKSARASLGKIKGLKTFYVLMVKGGNI